MAFKMKGSALYGSPMKKYGHKSPARMKDLSGDGKITRKDVLIGRGVIPSPAKHGTTMDFSYGRNGHHPDKMEASHEDWHRAKAERQEKLKKKKPSPAKMKSSPMLKKTCNCWDGYKRVAGTKPCAKGSCAKA